LGKSAKSIWVGFAIGFACILYSIKLSGDLRTFLNWPSVLITLGGTTGAVVVSFPMERLKAFWPLIKKAFTNEKYDLEQDIELIVSLAETARRESLLALEDAVDQYTDDKFLKKGILMIIDGADKEQLRDALETEIGFMQQRHQKGHAMLDMIASTVTSLGLLGTYIGLIPMLVSLEDPTKLGPLMAIELVTSFYGAFFAYVIFSPLSRKLKVMSSDEVARKEFLIEGLTMIEENQNPKMIKDRLTFYTMSKQDTSSMRSQRRQSKPNIREVA
jgi:chemotaxis protein MotA